MRNLKFISLVCALILSVSVGLSAKASLQSANWCFGHGGQISFKSGTPVELSSSSVNTDEGVATISDTDGNLLFYTDGMSVWNKNHQVMPNGYGLLGNSSSSQSGVIVPYPGNKNLYYVFTVDAIWNSHIEGYGFRYSIVDLTKNNGLGDVIKKNEVMFTPSCEKITAVGHLNGKDIWVLGQRWLDNKIAVYLVDKNGIHLQNEYPIKALAKYTKQSWTKGCMKFSQKGDLLAVANNGVSLALYDFDVRTGAISNERFTTTYEFKNSYGVEFSSNSKYLYISSTPYGDNESVYEKDLNYLMQLDLESAKTGTFENSWTKLAEFEYNKGTTDAYMGSLQLALDGKIYLSSYERSWGRLYANYLSVINNPEDKNCNFVFKGFKLKEYSASLGLPSFIQSFFRPEVTKFVTSDYCDGEDVVFHSDYYAGFKYQWTGPNNFISDTCDTVVTKPDRSFAGTYKLFVTDTFGFTDTSEFVVNYHKTDLTTDILDTVPDKYIQGGYVKILTLTNNYTEPVMVDSFYLKSGKKYTLQSTALPFAIYGGENRTYKIQIDSRVSGFFRDTIVISVSQPCPFSTKIALADSIGKIVLHIVLPDTTVNLGETFLSDIKAYIEPKTGKNYTFDLDFTYSYLSYIYNTTKYQTFAHTKEISGTKELITLPITQLVMNDSIKTLATVRGITLMCSEYVTPLEFTNCSLSDSAFGLVLHNGKIQVLREDCTKELFKIKGSNMHVAYSQPTPLTNGGKIELFSPDKGKLKLSIYSVVGSIIEEYDFESPGVFAKEVELDLSKYSNGLYTLIWESNNNTSRKTILINK
jgi:hypothetical protein